MIALLVGPFGKYIIGAIIVAGAIAVFFGLKHEYDEGKRDEGRAEIQKAWDKDRATRIKALTDITMLWDAKRQEAENAQQQVYKERAARLALAAERIKALPSAVALARFPGAAVGVLESARDSSADTTQSPAKPSESPAADSADSNIGLITGWGVEVIGLYNACRDQVIGWQRFYLSLQQPKEAP